MRHNFQKYFYKATVLLFLLYGLQACTQAKKEVDITFERQPKVFFDFEDRKLNIEDQGKYAVFTAYPYVIFPSISNSPSNHVLRELRVQFSGGVKEQRWAHIADEQNHSSQNRILEFGLTSAYSDIDSQQSKGRVQLNVGFPSGARRLLIELKMKLGDGFEVLRSSDVENNWLTIAEWWNDEVWIDSPYEFSMGVNLIKPKNTNKLFFSAHGRTFNKQVRPFDVVWKQSNKRFEVPVGEWLKIKYLIVEGKYGDGQFKMYVARRGEEYQEVFNIYDSTVHPDNPSADGITAFNPLKLYTSDRILNMLQNQQQSLVLFFDDLSISFE